MKKTYFNIAAISVLSVFLAACGFKLHSSDSLPPKLHKFYLKSDNPYGQFEVFFKKALKSSKIVLLPSSNKTDPILNLNSTYSSTTTDAYSNSNSRVYTISYTATISITDGIGKILLNPQTISTSRSITLQSNEMIETTPQTDIIKYEMQQELSTKILNILCAKKTFKALL